MLGDHGSTRKITFKIMNDYILFAVEFSELGTEMPVHGSLLLLPITLKQG
jgi:hypothetical protein